MSANVELLPENCNCSSLRQAARYVTQLYDQFLAPSGLRLTQFAILSKLERSGPLTINVLAGQLVMDRTTLGRTILPLEREGLVAIRQGSSDRRSKELHLTSAGAARLRRAMKGWAQAQVRFERAFGAGKASDLRGLLRKVTASDLHAVPGRSAVVRSGKRSDAARMTNP